MRVRSSRRSGNWSEPFPWQNRMGSPWKILDDAGRQPSRRPVLDCRSEVVEAHGQAQARGNLQVGCVRGLASEDALRYPVVDALEHPRKGGDRAADILVRGSAGSRID